MVATTAPTRTKVTSQPVISATPAHTPKILPFSLSSWKVLRVICSSCFLMRVGRSAALCLQGCELGFDLVGVPQHREFLVEALRAGDRQRLVVDEAERCPALQHLEAREAVVDPARQALVPETGVAGGGLDPGEDRPLPLAGLAKLGLEPCGVVLHRADLVLEHGTLGAEFVGRLGGELLLGKGGAGEIVAVLGKGELGFLFPVGLELLEPGDLAFDLLPVGRGAG